LLIANFGDAAEPATHVVENQKPFLVVVERVSGRVSEHGVLAVRRGER
jgi:hypothetical protein